MLLIDIMDKGFGVGPTYDIISSKGSFSEFIFSFVLEKYIICAICTVKSPAFETTSLLYVTQLNILPCRNYWCRSTNKNCIRPVLVVEGTLGI